VVKIRGLLESLVHLNRGDAPAGVGPPRCDAMPVCPLTPALSVVPVTLDIAPFSEAQPSKCLERATTKGEKP